MPVINLLDLFSGIGGFHQGILEANIKINKCFNSEIDKNANNVYKKHFNNSVNLGDVKTIRVIENRIKGELQKKKIFLIQLSI